MNKVTIIQIGQKQKEGLVVAGDGGIIGKISPHQNKSVLKSLVIENKKP